MHIHIATIGRLKKGPEQELVARYADRIKKSGKAIGLTELNSVEISESRADTNQLRKREEAQNLLSRLPDGAVLVAFDERGNRPSSREFAKFMGDRIDGGAAHIAFVVGGPDGLCDTLRDRADSVVAFGSLTMPHQLVRVLVLEQIYRSITILTGHPYHRD